MLCPSSPGVRARADVTGRSSSNPSLPAEPTRPAGSQHRIKHCRFKISNQRFQEKKRAGTRPAPANYSRLSTVAWRLIFDSLRRRRVDDPLDLRNAIGGESAQCGVLPDGVGVRSHIDAIQLVVGHEAFEPLNLRPYPPKYCARLLRNRLQFVCCQLSRAGNLPLDYILWHGSLLWKRAAAFTRKHTPGSMPAATLRSAVASQRGAGVRM